MDIYVLVLIYGITGWGAGGYRQIEFPTKAACHEAISTMVIKGTKQRAGEDDEQLIVFCQPKQKR